MGNGVKFSEICPKYSNLISGTKTSTGLKVKAKLDKKTYETKIKVPDETFDSINIQFHKKHPNWNYTITCKK